MTTDRSRGRAPRAPRKATTSCACKSPSKRHQGLYSARGRATKETSIGAYAQPDGFKPTTTSSSIHIMALPSALSLRITSQGPFVFSDTTITPSRSNEERSLSAYRATELPWHRNKRSRGTRELETRSPNILKQSAPVGAHIPSARYWASANCRAATLSSKSRGTATKSQHGNPATVSQRKRYRATLGGTGANLTRASSTRAAVTTSMARTQHASQIAATQSIANFAIACRLQAGARLPRKPSTSTGLTHNAEPIPLSLPVN